MGPLIVADETIVLRDDQGGEHRATVAADGRVTLGDVIVPARLEADGTVRLDGSHYTLAWTAVSGDTWWVFIDGQVFTFEVEQPASRRPRRIAAPHGSLTAPMPATVRRIAVKAGDAVRLGDVLIVLEAMKMELPVRAASDGTVKVVNCQEGEMVQAGQELVEIDP